MTAQDYLTAFDLWLTARIEEAHAFGKDLAFRDRTVNSPLKLDDDGAAWDHRLLEPGQSAPQGEGWSVYRLQGVWPDFAGEAAPEPPRAAGRRRKPLIAALSEAVFGQRA
jgi:hypothetical protein